MEGLGGLQLPVETLLTLANRSPGALLQVLPALQPICWHMGRMHGGEFLRRFIDVLLPKLRRLSVEFVAVSEVPWTPFTEISYYIPPHAEERVRVPTHLLHKIAFDVIAFLKPKAITFEVCRNEFYESLPAWYTATISKIEVNYDQENVWRLVIRRFPVMEKLYMSCVRPAAMLDLKDLLRELKQCRSVTVANNVTVIVDDAALTQMGTMMAKTGRHFQLLRFKPLWAFQSGSFTRFLTVVANCYKNNEFVDLLTKSLTLGKPVEDRVACSMIFSCRNELDKLRILEEFRRAGCENPLQQEFTCESATFTFEVDVVGE